MKRILLPILALGLLSFAAHGADTPPRKPNIIFVLTDDLGYGDYGVFFQNLRRAQGDRAQPWHMTPNIDAMAAEGVQLRQHYCAAPVCAPSRASLLLGVHQGHANVRDNQFDKALEENHTLATVLKGAGYATAAIGKWGLQGEGKSPAVWAGYPTKRGFDFYYGYVRHKDGHFHYPKEDGIEVWENEREVSAGLAGCYTTDLFTARAKRWIADQHTARPEQPFFLYLAYDTPHAKLQLPPGPYPAGGVQWAGEPGRMLNTTGTPDSWTHPDYAGATWDHDGNPATPEQPWPDVYKRYATDVRRIDDALGDLLHYLKELRIEEETLVVFTSDNGPSRESYLPQAYEPTFFHSFGPFDGIKRDCWEGGIRVGAIVRWPGRAPAQVSELPSQSQDWLPTFAEFAGVPVPARADGTSLVPTITGRGQQTVPLVYVEYANGEKTPGYREFEASRRNRVRKQMQAIRAGDLVGVRYDVRAATDPFEIYNVIADPKEAKNLAPELPEVQARLQAQVLGLRMPDAMAPRPYDTAPIPGAPMAGAGPGVRCEAFERQGSWLPRLEDLPAPAGKIVTTLALPEGAEEQDTLLRGFLRIESEGAYTFTLPARSIGLLRIHEATVIDAAYAPGPEKSGTIHLGAGWHPFRFYYRAGGPPEWSGPGMERQEIPATALRY